MDFTLNELSLATLSSKDEAIKVFMQLSDVAASLESIGFKTMKIWDKSVFYTHPFHTNTTLIGWLKQKHFQTNEEKVRSQKLKSIIQKKDSDWTDQERTLIVECPIVGIQLQDNQAISEGLKIACLYNTIAVSFNSSTQWNKSSLDLIHMTENEQGETLEQSVSVKHASSLTHIDEQKEWLDYLIAHKLIGTDWKPSENYFPHLEFSNALIENGNWETFKQKRDGAKSNQERLAIIIEIGKKVAERNSYTHDNRVSTINTSDTVKRIIFGAGKGKDKIYLSIDLEKGGFEVCNYLGEHIGEYFYDGSEISGKKAGHDIRVKS